jgi:hypothetical protein
MKKEFKSPNSPRAFEQRASALERQMMLGKRRSNQSWHATEYAAYAYRNANYQSLCCARFGPLTLVLIGDVW